MNDDNELFSIPPPPLPPLEAARRKLWAAEAKLIEIDYTAADDLGIETERAEKEVREAEEAVKRLERETLLRETQRHSSTGT